MECNWGLQDLIKEKEKLIEVIHDTKDKEDLKILRKVLYTLKKNIKSERKNHIEDKQDIDLNESIPYIENSLCTYKSYYSIITFLI